MLTRIQFDKACKELIAKYSCGECSSPATSPLTGWSWNEHSLLQGLGFMSRARIQLWKSKTLMSDQPCELDDLEEKPQEDDATLSVQIAPDELMSQQYVVYSPTFQVPAFYFTVHDSRGAPLTLADLLKTSFLHAFAFENTQASTFGLTYSTSSFPLLSQGDHPTLGTPCWYLHPCETSQSVEEVMSEVDTDGWSSDQRLVRWLEAWFMVVGTAVNFKV